MLEQLLVKTQLKKQLYSQHSELVTKDYFQQVEQLKLWFPKVAWPTVTQLLPSPSFRFIFVVTASINLGQIESTSFKKL
jgi:hypothetical protein